MTDIEYNAETNEESIVADGDLLENTNFPQNLSPIEENTLQQYIQGLRKYPQLVAEDELILARLAQRGDLRAREIIIQSSLRFVVIIAKQYKGRGIDLLDLIAEGNLGLIYALDKFNTKLGYRFSTYAQHWIRQNIEQAILRQTRIIRLPVHVIRELNACLKVKRRLEQAATENVSMLVIAKYLATTSERVSYLLNLNQSVLSLDSPLESNPSLSLADLIPDEKNSIDTQLTEEEVMQHIESWIDSLPQKHKTVILRRFGLFNNDEATLDELANDLNVTPERVRQIQKNALKRLMMLLEESRFSKEALL